MKGKTTFLTKALTLLFVALFSLTGARAEQALPYSYGFENNNLTAEGWTTVYEGTANASKFGITTDALKTGTYGFRFSSYSKDNTTYDQYLISPELNATYGIIVTFYYKAYSSFGTETFKVGYSTTDTDPSSFTFGEEVSTNSTDWTLSDEFVLPAGTKYVAVYYYSNYQYYLYVDDFSFEAESPYPSPKNLAIDYEGGMTANVSWTSNENAISYDIDVNGTVTENVTSPYTLTGLLLSGTYEVKVRANYGGGNYSEWTAPVSFRTDDCENPMVFKYSLSDSWGDGWNGNAINVIDGEEHVVATVTLENGSSATGTIRVCGSYVRFEWVKGSYPAETSWTFTDASDNVVFSGTGNTDWASGYVLYEIDPSPAKPSDLAESNIGTTSATLSWEGTNDSYVVQYRPWTQVGEDVTSTATMTTYTYDLSAFSGTGSVAIRHYDVTDMFQLIVDDIEVTNAGGSVVFSENFETSGGSMPNSFSNIDLDGDDYVWGIASSSNSNVNGTYGIVSESFNNDLGAALTPDNWLIVSGIELGGTISFAARGQDASYAAENFAVYVSADADFTEVPVTGTSYNAEGLIPSTPYTWQVKGITGGEPSRWAASMFKTKDDLLIFANDGEWDDIDNWTDVNGDPVTALPTTDSKVRVDAAAVIPNGTVAYAGKTTIDGGSITIEDGGQLKHKAATLKVTMEKEIAAGENNLIATPFSGTTQLSYSANWSHVLNVTTGNYDLYGFDPTATNEWINYKTNSTHAVFTLGSNNGLVYGVGYFYANEADQTLQFTGTTASSVNNSMTADITYEGTRSDSFNGWKSIGNPYTCTGYITYSAAATFYKLNAEGTGFDVYENAVALAPGEGAFVKVTASGTLTYSSEPLSVEPVAAGSFYNLVLPVHGETDDQDADPSVIIFANDADNTALIESLDGQTCDVQLKGRTIYKDGDWNTICLPFDLTAEQIEASLGAGADIRAIGSVALEGNTLNISFTPEGDTSKFASGVPYIIKWASGDNIADPIFYGVEISKDLVTNNKFEYGEGKSVSFLGTYGYTKFDDANRSILFMGAANTLYYPGAGAEIGAFRAYFELEGITAGDPVTPSEPTKFVLRFDKDSADGIKNVNDNLNETIYNLAGQRLNKAQKGINIVNGKKIAIK